MAKITDKIRLDFLIDNRLNVARWNDVHGVVYLVTDENDGTLARGATGREAIDAALQDAVYLK